MVKRMLLSFVVAFVAVFSAVGSTNSVPAAKVVVLLTESPKEASGGVRVFDYVVQIIRDDAEVARSVVLSPGCFLPERLSRLDGEALFGVDELPQQKALRVCVTPRDCYGTEGPVLQGEPFFV